MPRKAARRALYPAARCHCGQAGRISDLLSRWLAAQRPVDIGVCRGRQHDSIGETLRDQRDRIIRGVAREPGCERRIPACGQHPTLESRQKR
jgi:hypothetical protein